VDAARASVLHVNPDAGHNASSKEHSMRITPALRKEINAAVRRCTDGANPFAEVGLRAADSKAERPWLPNALNWDVDSDLGDIVALRMLRSIDEHTAAPNCAVLDLYVTTGSSTKAWGGRELETNVYVFIRDGHVVDATSKDLQVPALSQRIGFPPGNGWVMQT
jgi:hypothetical protein